MDRQTRAGETEIEEERERRKRKIGRGEEATINTKNKEEDYINTNKK